MNFVPYAQFNFALLNVTFACDCYIELPSTSTNICSLFVIRYALMLDCWKEAPDERPSFEQLVSTLETLMTAGTPYYDFEKLDETNACYSEAQPGSDK